jgi:hypothetical protein
MIDRKGAEPLGPDSLVLQLNGVPTRFADGVAGDCFLQSPRGTWRPLEDDGLYSVEAECIALHDDLAASIFGGLDVYWKLLLHVSPFLSQAGLNSEAPIGRDDFEKALVKLAAFPELNRFLYLYDCQVLVSAIQECTKEVSQLTGEFYRILNLESFFTPGVPVEDGIRWSTSPTVTMLFSTLGFLFIRMHSLLDYLAKLACEIESIRTDFPRLASLKLPVWGPEEAEESSRARGSLEPCSRLVTRSSRSS